MKTVLITGASTGIGKTAAEYFATKGWNVAATMRKPEKADGFLKAANIRLYALDVTQPQSIRTAIELCISDFGGLDVIVNNAGYGAIGIFEKASPEQIRKQFETNVFGVMNVIREILPHFRRKRNGTIINITSTAGLTAFPIYSVYHATKWAVEGFSESLAYELRQFNIKVKCVEPGAIKTDFYSRSQDLFSNDGLSDYDRYEQITYANTQKEGEKAPGPEVVAKVIYKAAVSNNFKIRYPAGAQSRLMLNVRRLIPVRWFNAIIRHVVEKGL
jgi:NAD(P)-dependent dehydrogenase (short-subunit alcohol dehydrogenase family)